METIDTTTTYKIDPKELRIGNIFSLHDERGYLGDIKLKAESIVLAQNDIKEFQSTHCPYRLTEEWLVKFGFELDSVNKFRSVSHNILRTDKLYEFNTFDHEIKGMKIEVILNDDESEVRRIGIKDSLGAANDIQYVHQLQNIYFALTKDELIVK